MNFRAWIATGTLALAMSLSLTCPARGDLVLDSYQWWIAGGSAQFLDSIRIALGMVTAPPVSDPQNQIFFVDGVETDSTTVGTTWISDPAHMALMLDQLQDDEDHDQLGVGIAYDTPWGYTHSYFNGLSEYRFPVYGLDLDFLAAHTDEIRVTLLSFELVSPGHNPNGDGVWTDYRGTFRFEFVAIPGPGAAALLVIGCMMLARRSASRCT